MGTPFDDKMAKMSWQYIQSDRAAPVSEADISGFESAIGYALPSDYRSFVLTYGLASGRQSEFVIPRLDTVVEVFYGLAPATDYDLSSHRKQLSDRLPSTYLGIASSPGGEIVLSLAGGDKGSVYWWNREGCFEPRSATFVDVDFESFLRSLTNE